LADDDRIVVIGASAGGVEALIGLIPKLPRGFPAPVCIVVHIPADSPGLLASILARRSKVNVEEATDGATLVAGTVYVAQPDCHLIVEHDRTLRLTHGPRENRHRPAVDPLFRSAALAYGNGAIGVILSGSLDDGTAGLLAIKRVGGMAVVQSPEDALYSGMPQSALENVDDIDFVVPLAEIPEALDRCLKMPRLAPVPPPRGLERMEMEKRISEMDEGAMETDDRPGQPSAFSCPDCGGVLWEIADGEYARFRCRVGHAFSPETMLGAQSEIFEEALWTALKTLEESATLSKRLAAAERQRGHDWMSKRFQEREAEARERAEVIRRVLARVNGAVPVEAAEPQESSQ
jgi:two-component system chemotaxis response regulator CheB